jgi:hypothetical protein
VLRLRVRHFAERTRVGGKFLPELGTGALRCLSNKFLLKTNKAVSDNPSFTMVTRTIGNFKFLRIIRRTSAKIAAHPTVLLVITGAVVML